MNTIRIIECPRDAMQGLHDFIPTAKKTEYLNQLLKVGFDTIDFGSFVSPKAVPQLADTAEVLAGLDLSDTRTKLLAIVANRRGAEDACSHPEIQFLGYPLSISETFQQRNTKKSISESLELVKEMLDLSGQAGKELVIYISMGFGNPYGDPWSPEVAVDWVGKMAGLGVNIISMADTVGTADHSTIRPLFEKIIPAFPGVEFGAHFHATPSERKAKLQAAWEGGCRRFDSAIMGFGGCPFAEDDLVGNIATESLIDFLENDININTGLKKEEMSKALMMAGGIFY